MAQKKDEGLNGNEKIEQAVYQLQQEPTQEQLAHTLTVIRRRMDGKTDRSWWRWSRTRPVSRCSCGPSARPMGPAGGMPLPALKRR